MIEKLTPEQEAKMPEYVEKWVSIITNTERLDFDETAKIVDGFRQIIEMTTGVPLFIVDNPIEAWVACSIIITEFGDLDDVNKGGKAYKKYIQKVNEFIDSGTLRQKIDYVFDNPKNCGYAIETPCMPYQTGSLFSSVFSFCDYFLTEFPTEIKITDELKNKYRLWEMTSKIGSIYPLKGFTVVSQKPTEIYVNENNQLHCDGGPCVVYNGRGDYKLFALNGVAVPEWLATIPAQELKIEQYNNLVNSDEKAEFVRKIGIEQFIDRGKKIDTYENYDQEEHDWWWRSEYELWDMACMFSQIAYQPYLKMKNQTTNVWHLEAVSPNCRTLKDAIKERFGGRDMKIVAIA